MHLRSDSPQSLDDLREDWRHHDRTWTSDACVPEINFKVGPHKDPTITLGEHTVPLDEDAVNRLCRFYGIPIAFFGRLMTEEKHRLMNSRIHYAAGEVTIAYSELGITDVSKPTQPRMDPLEFISVAHRVYGTQAEVLDAWCNADDLRLDVFGPHVADGVRGGLRLAQNRRQNLAPTVAPLLYHEETTSIIQVPDRSLKIDARGLTVERIAYMLQAEARRAEARLATDVRAFLDLARTPIGEDRDTRLQRIADEHNMPARPLAGITAAMAAEEEPTLLDLALAISNAANAPKLDGPEKGGARAKLQAIAGAIVSDHAERCSACHALVPAA